MVDLGLVVIGRNEGARLVRCLDALRGIACPVVYVDSCSSDDSVAAATVRGIPVHVLDPAQPLNAARARNEGLARLLELHPDLRYVQFVDGDSSLSPDWLPTARAALEADPHLGIVAGALAERQAARSVYHLLAALEWRRPTGPIDATGGIFMARVAALKAAGGFDGTVPAGEEADLCQRVRACGYRIEQLEAAMGTHDMGDLGARGWWLRNVRTGHAYAQGAIGGRYRRELRSALAWGLVLPAVALALAWPTGGYSAALLALYPVQGTRIAVRVHARGWSGRESFWYGMFTVLAKAPEALGALRLACERLQGRAPTLVRYR